MFVLTIVFKQHSANVQLNFSTFKSARDILDRIDKTSLGQREPLELADDYGQIASFDKGNILVCAITDNEQAHKAAEEKAISQARAQALTNRRAQADPVISNQLITKPLMGQ